MLLPLTRRVIPLSLAAILASAVAHAADDVVIEETQPTPPAPRPQVFMMPPRVRIQMRQMQEQDNAPGAGETRVEPYLGVVTGPVSDQLRAQLELPEGIGLTVDAVAKDGPAGRGGVKQFDILQKFDDQLVCTAEQLSALVKAAGKGKEVKLTVIRAGKEQQLDVLIDEREVAVGGPAAAPFAGLPGMPLELEGLLGDMLPPGIPGFGEDIRAQVQQQVQEAIEQAQAGGFGGDVNARVLQIFPGGASQNVVVVADQRGTVEIRETDGKRTVTVKDPAGKEVHQGPLDTDADREQVPEAFRGMVEEVEGRLGGGRRWPGRGETAEQPADDNEI
jgi:hypothetical protein